MPNYFQEALSDFTYDVAGKGAVEHLADLGLNVRQICGKLDYPLPEERVALTVWDHYFVKGVLLAEEPGSTQASEEVSYVQEVGEYGKTSFRRVVKSNGTNPWEVGDWKEILLEQGQETDPLAEITRYRQKEKETSYSVYFLCEFGKRKYQKPELWEEAMAKLPTDERDYLVTLPWKLKPTWHLLNDSLYRILMKLSSEFWLPARLKVKEN